MAALADGYVWIRYFSGCWCCNLESFNLRETRFSAHEMADMEQVQIERSGITTDVIPDSCN